MTASDSASAPTLPSTMLSFDRPLRFIVTGAGRGLGRGLSRLLLSSGHDVFLLDNDEGELQHTLKEHLPKHLKSQSESNKASGSRFDGTTCDVSNVQSVRRALHAAREFHRDGKIDILLNNAARTGPYWKNIDSLTQLNNNSTDNFQTDDAVLQEWQSYLSVNLTGAFNVTRLSLDMLKHDNQQQDFQPSVIFISSTRAKQSEPNHEAYASTKAGLLGLNHALASSLQPIGIRSNAILPGWLPSGHESRTGDEQGQQWTSDLTEQDQTQHWSGRVGRIEDLYNAVMFLATTRFANGQEIVLDGGMTKKMQYVE